MLQGIPNETNFAAINNTIQRLRPRPEFICFANDNISGLTKDYASLRAEWDYWLKSEMAWLDVPLFSTASSHTTYDGESERIFQEVFRGFPRNGASGQEGLSYYVRQEVLDTEGRCVEWPAWPLSITASDHWRTGAGAEAQDVLRTAWDDSLVFAYPILLERRGGPFQASPLDPGLLTQRPFGPAVSGKEPEVILVDAGRSQGTGRLRQQRQGTLKGAPHAGWRRVKLCEIGERYG
jgi:hypothetical protein